MVATYGSFMNTPERAISLRRSLEPDCFHGWRVTFHGLVAFCCFWCLAFSPFAQPVEGLRRLADAHLSFARTLGMPGWMISTQERWLSGLGDNAAMGHVGSFLLISMLLALVAFLERRRIDRELDDIQFGGRDAVNCIRDRSSRRGRWEGLALRFCFCGVLFSLVCGVMGAFEHVNQISRRYTISCFGRTRVCNLWTPIVPPLPPLDTNQMSKRFVVTSTNAAVRSDVSSPP